MLSQTKQETILLNVALDWHSFLALYNRTLLENRSRFQFKLRKRRKRGSHLPGLNHFNRTIMALAPNKFRAEFPSHKNQFHRNYAAEIRGNYQESSDCFEYPQKSLLKSSHPQKNTFQNILTPQKIRK